MFKPLGLLFEAAVCPAHLQDHGSCDKDRSQCPFGHPPKQQQQQQQERPAQDEPRATVSAKAVPATAAPRGTQPLVKKRKINTYEPASKPSTIGSDIRSAASPSAPASRPAQASSSSTQYRRPPVIQASTHPRKSLIPLSSRNTCLKTLWTEYTTFYAPLIQTDAAFPILQDVGRKLAFQDAISQESDAFIKASKHTYKTSVVTTITGLRKRSVDEIQRATDELIAEYEDDASLDSLEAHLRKTCTEVGTAAEVDNKRRAIEQRAKSKLTVDRLQALRHITPPEVLVRSGYDAPLSESDCKEASSQTATASLTASTETIDAAWGTGSSRIDFVGDKKTCARCQSIFTVQPTSEASHDACIYHWGKRRFIKDTQSRSRIQQWTCCQRNVDGSQLGGAPSLSELAGYGGPSQKIEGDSAGCCSGPHVFKEEQVDVLHKMEAYVSTQELSESADDTRGAHDILAFDCEMAYTTAGMDVTRVTFLAESGEVVLDQLIKPRADVLDTNIRFSGVSPSQLTSPDLPTLQSFRATLTSYLHSNTILIGHGLENDLRALRLLHPKVIDTALLFPHPKGPPLRLGLKALSEQYLNRSIQMGSGTDAGHSSHEDAKAALDLVKYAAIREVQPPWERQGKRIVVGNAAAQAQAPGSGAASVAPTAGNRLIAGGKPRVASGSTAAAGSIPAPSVLLHSGRKSPSPMQSSQALSQQTRATTAHQRPPTPSSSSSSSSLLFIPKKKPRA